jgi:hypothetical protein
LEARVYWTDESIRRPIVHKVLGNISVVADRSCMTIMYFEFFPTVKKKLLLTVMKDKVK